LEEFVSGQSSGLFGFGYYGYYLFFGIIHFCSLLLTIQLL